MNSIKTKLMFGVEHCYSKGDSTYEIFETLDEAIFFTENKEIWNSTNKPLYIFKADFNTELIFKEDSGNWNYDDFSDTIFGNYEQIKTINKQNDLDLLIKR